MIPSPEIIDGRAGSSFLNYALASVAPRPRSRCTRAHIPRPAGEPTTPTPVPVSVIVPAYNRAHILGRALRSILAQRPNPPAEVIVVDDCSQDGTAEVAHSMGVRLLQHDTNRGAAAARNTGIHSATQPWIALLDSDDEWLEHHLRTLWELRDGYGVVAGSTLRCGADPRGDRFLGTTTPRPVVLRSPRLLVFPNNFIPSCAGLFRRDLLLRAGGYDTSLRFSEDFDLLLRMLELAPAVVSPTVVALYHAHTGQKTHRMDDSRVAQRSIVAKYRDQPWWSPQLSERRYGALLWDELSAALAAGERLRARATVRKLLASRSRLEGMLGTWVWRLLVRRRSGRVARDGGPSVMLLGDDPSVRALLLESLDAAALRDPPGPGWRAQLVWLARRPPAIAVVPSRRWALVARLLGIRPLRPDDVERNPDLGRGGP